jgi:hypothetical protein
MSDRSSFHKVGAATAEVPSPVVFFELNVVGAIKKRQFDLRLWADEFFTIIRSLINIVRCQVMDNLKCYQQYFKFNSIYILWEVIEVDTE